MTATHPSGVRTYKQRSGRLTLRQEDALSRLWPRLGVAVDGRPLDLRELFGRSAPVVLEIGFGMGESTAEMAAAQPDRDVLAVDVHTPGQGSLLQLVESAELGNVRVAAGDARVVLAEMLPSRSLAEVRVFFPDPWPKARHAKRRLVSPAFADLVADRLVAGGLLHVATDVPAYASQVLRMLGSHPAFVLCDDPPWRPTTKYERRGVRAGHPVRDIAATRRAGTNPVEPWRDES
ncbi:MAG TPA: tRNA (guanosine(46)-N7)-methyltransferase TrmB [Actinomycetes bacterium]